MTQEHTSFASLGLAAPLLQALENLNFSTPSPIQEQSIPWMLQHKDIVGLAKTGTGKTAAFGLSILNNLNPDLRHPQALIITPTRELAIQVAAHLELLSAKMHGIEIIAICGGQDYRPQLQKLRQGVHIVVGTPGRILDHLQRKSLHLNHLQTFVLDEADEMLRMGFIDDVEAILAQLPEQRHIALFSATMPPRIRQIGTRYLNNPVHIEIKSKTATVTSIDQRFLFCAQNKKPEALSRILAVEPFQSVIIFVRTKSSADEVAQLLQTDGHQALAIHGDLSQPLRERIIQQFKQGTTTVLVATDVAARGLDVDRVSHVINYDLTQDCETYVHRIGRTGRAGRSGVAISFITPKEARLLNQIERHTREPIKKIQVPSDAMIHNAREQHLFQSITERLNHKELDAYKELLAKYVRENDVPNDDLAAILALMLHQDQPWHKPFKSFTNHEEKHSTASGHHGKKRMHENKKSSKSRHEIHYSGQDSQQALFRLDVGKVHGVKPGNIVGAIANEAGLHSRYITGLKIHDHYSTVFLPKEMDKQVFNLLNKAWVCGRQLNIKVINAA